MSDQCRPSNHPVFSLPPNARLDQSNAVFIPFLRWLSTPDRLWLITCDNSWSWSSQTSEKDDQQKKNLAWQGVNLAYVNNLRLKILVSIEIIRAAIAKTEELLLGLIALVGKSHVPETLQSCSRWVLLQLPPSMEPVRWEVHVRLSSRCVSELDDLKWVKLVYQLKSSSLEITK